jgi:hypothetical protein
MRAPHFQAALDMATLWVLRCRISGREEPRALTLQYGLVAVLRSAGPASDGPTHLSDAVVY